MPRHKKRRCCRYLGGKKVFKPIAIPAVELETVEVELDEFEAIRLCDLDGRNQIEAGGTMGISRGTVQRLLRSGRAKIADALLHNKMIMINDHSIKGRGETDEFRKNCNTD